MIATIIVVALVGAVGYLVLLPRLGRYLGHVAGKHRARARDDRWDA